MHFYTGPPMHFLSGVDTGPTGTGKTWLSCALGHRACRDNRSVLYHRVPRLLETLGLARGDGRYARMLKSLARVPMVRGSAPNPRRLGHHAADRRATARFAGDC